MILIVALGILYIFDYLDDVDPTGIFIKPGTPCLGATLLDSLPTRKISTSIGSVHDHKRVDYLRRELVSI